MTQSSDFIAFLNEDYSVEKERNKAKRVIKKILKSRVYKEIDFLMTTFFCFLIIYAPFFWRYFWPSKIISSVELWNAMDSFFVAIIYMDKTKK